MRLILVTFLFIAALPITSWADIYVIVNNQNPIQTINKKTTIDIFMGKTKSFENGTRTYAIDQPSGSKVRADFYKSLTGKSIAYVNAYWARLFYTGRKRPPADHFKNTEAILNEVSTNVYAIAYIEAESAPANTKVVLTLPN